MGKTNSASSLVELVLSPGPSLSVVDGFAIPWMPMFWLFYRWLQHFDALHADWMPSFAARPLTFMGEMEKMPVRLLFLTSVIRRAHEMQYDNIIIY